MSQERIQPRPYLKLLALAALLGLISAVITFIFLVLVRIRWPAGGRAGENLRRTLSVPRLCASSARFALSRAAGSNRRAGRLGLGIAGALLPLTLFSGEAETAEIIHWATAIGAAIEKDDALRGLTRFCRASALKSMSR